MFRSRACSKKFPMNFLQQNIGLNINSLPWNLFPSSLTANLIGNCSFTVHVESDLGKIESKPFSIHFLQRILASFIQSTETSGNIIIHGLLINSQLSFSMSEIPD